MISNWKRTATAAGVLALGFALGRWSAPGDAGRFADKEAGQAGKLVAGAAREAASQEPGPRPDPDDRRLETAEQPTVDPDRTLQTAAAKQSEELVSEALQIESLDRHDAALEAIRAGLGDGDPVVRLAALQAFLGVSSLEFDRSGFREAVLPLLAADDTPTRRAAFYALYQTGVQDGDVELVRALEHDPGMRANISHLLHIYEKGDLTGESGEVVVRLLEQAGSARDQRELLRGLWGAQFAPSLERAILDLAASGDHELRHDAVYFALSTQQNKSGAVVDFLVECLSDPDQTNVAGRAAWGLRQGVPPELYSRVADVALTLSVTRRPGELTGDALRMLSRYATADQLASIEELLALPALREDLRQELGSIADRLRGPAVPEE